MGQLHEGHLSLIRAAKKRCDEVLVSIFVNPTQFAAGEDYDRYPRNLKADRKACASVGVDAIFAPSEKTMYPEPPLVSIRIPHLQDTLCGASRPGHFDGVCLVVSKLLNIATPHELYLGQKDYQQSVILRRLVKELDLPVSVRVCPTVRETDGLAMSSRNAYLAGEDRKEAVRLIRALRAGKAAIEGGERRAAAVARMLSRALTSPAVRVDYVAVVDPFTLGSVSVIERDVVLLVAAYVGGARLIDNVRVRVAGRTSNEKRGRAR